MKILYFGGQKSGKSLCAENKTLQIAKQKPYYIATYNNSFKDTDMEKRINKHKIQRENNFITIEEILDLTKVIKKDETYLIDCLSMWIFNNIENREEILLKQIEDISKIEANIVFVLNEVGSGVIPIDKLSRKFLDFTGIIGQKVVSYCDEVYEVKFGLEKRLK